MGQQKTRSVDRTALAAAGRPAVHAALDQPALVHGPSRKVSFMRRFWTRRARTGGHCPEIGQADGPGRRRPGLVRLALFLAIITVLALTGAACAAPFRTDAALRSYFATRPGIASVAAFDAVTGATYIYGPQPRFVTASTAKVAILGALLVRAQEAKRPLTAWENATAIPMIESSNNADATLLYNSVGGRPALARFMARVGMSHTIAGPGGYWGLTETTAADEVMLMRAVAYPNSVLTTASRAYALWLMSHPDKDHRWGVSAGARPGEQFAQKTGSGPFTVYGGKWAVHCMGRIWGGSRDLVIAVLTAGSPVKSVGVATVEQATRLANSGM